MRNRSGSLSYRVTGSFGGRQRKRVCQNLDDAVAVQEAWEHERLKVGAANRPKVTSLTLQQLREAETAFGLLESEEVGLLELVKEWIRQPRQKTRIEVRLEQLLDAFIEDRREEVSKAQFNTLRQHCSSFVRKIGGEIPIDRVDAEMVEAWLKEKGQAMKTWNNCRGSVATMFNWALHPRRLWLAQNPVELVKRFGKRALPVNRREILSICDCERLMAFVQKSHPEWCLCFALALFAGVRPDRVDGELFKLSKAVELEGASRYFLGRILYLSASIVKVGPDRETDIPENLARWIERYPPTPSALAPKDAAAYRSIRRQFKIPHDGLRHTAITAFIANGNTIAEAARQFGNSENMIRDHYRGRMTREDAERFYQIFPT